MSATGRKRTPHVLHYPLPSRGGSPLSQTVNPDAHKASGPIDLKADGVFAMPAVQPALSYKHSGAGCSHRSTSFIAKACMAPSKAMVLGQLGEIIGTYLAFTQDNELMLEYAGTIDVPENFRDLSVQIVVQGSAP